MIIIVYDMINGVTMNMDMLLTLEAAIIFHHGYSFQKSLELL